MTGDEIYRACLSTLVTHRMQTGKRASKEKIETTLSSFKDNLSPSDYREVFDTLVDAVKRDHALR